MTRITKLIYIIGSAIIGLAALLGIFTGLVATGAVDTDKTRIVFLSGSLEGEYDGNALTCEKWSIVSGTLKKGHVAKLSFTGSQTVAGSSENGYVVTIVDENGKDVTDQYTIESQRGRLSVLPRRIVVTLGSDEKVYDGTILKCTSYEITEGSILDAHFIDVAFAGEIKNVGTVANEAEVKIYDSNEEDVTANYELVCVPGTLTVTKRQLKITSDDAEKVYDGYSLTAEGFTIDEETTLVEGENVAITSLSALTDVGTEKNKFLATVSDEDGADKTGNYEIIKEFGTLTVSPREVTVRTSDAEAVYCGEALTSADCDFDEEDIAENQTASLSAEGSLTEVGETENVCTLTVLNEAGEDVSSNYVFADDSYIGVLRVTKRRINLNSLSDEKTYDGSPLTREAVEIEEYDEDSGRGILAGHMVRSEFSEGLTDAGEINNEFTFAIIDENGEDVTANYEVSAEFGTLTVYKRTIAIRTFDADKPYDGTPLTRDGYEVVDGYDGTAPNESLSVEVIGSITEMGERKNEFSVIVTSDFSGKYTTYNYDVITDYQGVLEIYGKIAITSSDYSRKYDGTTLFGADLAHGGFTVSVYTGNDTFYNINGTNSGEVALPGGNTLIVEVTGEQTTVGHSLNAFDYSVTDNDGNDITNKYRVSEKCGILSIEKRLVTISSISPSAKTYDGNPLKCNSSADVYVSYGSLVLGHEIEPEFSGSQTVVGTTANVFTARIVDGDDDVTDCYDISYVYGMLTVKKRAVTLHSPNDSKYYDGETYIFDDDDSFYYINDGALLSSDVASPVFYATPSALVGNYANTFKVSVYSVSLNKDVTDCYDITYDYGTIVIEKLAVTLRSPSGEKVYDGSVYTFGDYDLFYDLNDGALLPFDAATPVFYATSSALVGNYANTFGVSIYSAYLNKDVTDCYDITYEYGTIVIGKRAVTLRSPDGGKVYDGSAYTFNDYDSFDELNGSAALLPSDVATPVFYATPSADVGNYANTFIVSIFSDTLNSFVTDCYEITYVYGIDSITRRSIEARASAKTVFEYDGTAHSNEDEVTVSDPDDPFWSFTGTVEATFTSAITKVGEMPNLYTLALYSGGEDVARNYDVTYIYGVLAVTPRPLVITSEGAEKIYDGEPLTCGVYSYDGLAFGDSIVGVELPATLTEVDKIANRIGKVYIENASGESVTFCYDIERVEGYLVVTSAGGGSGGGGGGGGSGANGDLRGGYSESEVPLFTVNSEIDGTIYLKEASLGDYNGHAADNDVPVYKNSLYDAGLDKSVSLSYLPYYAMTEGGKTTAKVDVISYMNQYVLPYYAAPDINSTTNDVYVSGTASESYSFDFVYYNNIYRGTTSAYAAYEAAYRAFVYENYLGFDDTTLFTINGVTATTRGFLQSVIDKNDLDAGSLEDSINAIKLYLTLNNYYDKDYAVNSDLDEVDNPLVYFLTDPDCKGGICRHFAMAGTMLLRAMGYPARYTVGYVVNAIADTDVDIYQGHAWCEVYVDGVGWMVVEFTVGGAVVDDGPIDLDLSIKSTIYHPYIEGQTHFEKNITDSSGILSDFSLYKQAGYTYSAVIACDYAEAGDNITYLKSIVIYDHSGNDVTTSFNITCGYGNARLYLYKLEITGNPATKTYDGTPLTLVDGDLTVAVYDAHNTAVAFPEEYEMTVSFYGSQTEVASSPNYYNVTLTDVSDGENASRYFYVIKHYGVLSVTAVPISVSAPNLTVSTVSAIVGEDTTEVTLSATFNGVEEILVAIVDNGSSLTKKVVMSGADACLYVGDTLVKRYENAFSITNGSPIDGHNVSVSYGDMTVVAGQSKTVNPSVTILQGETDVTKKYYTVTTTKGRITLTS